MRIVLDTNALVSALLTPFGASSRALDLILAGDVIVLFDDRIISEYEEVLLRKSFGFDPSHVSELIEYIKATGEHVMARGTSYKLPDPDDAPFLEVAITGFADALVTGNKRHYPHKVISTLSPGEFLEYTKKEMT